MVLDPAAVSPFTSLFDGDGIFLIRWLRCCFRHLRIVRPMPFWMPPAFSALFGCWRPQACHIKAFCRRRHWKRKTDSVKMVGSYLNDVVATAALVTGLAITGADAVASDRVQVPDNATYLGNQMGGDFVALERHDIRADNGRMLPAFRIQIYAAMSNGAPYGMERRGMTTFDGYGLYVPPARTPRRCRRISPRFWRRAW